MRERICLVLFLQKVKPEDPCQFDIKNHLKISFVTKGQTFPNAMNYLPRKICINTGLWKGFSSFFLFQHQIYTWTLK